MSRATRFTVQNKSFLPVILLLLLYCPGVHKLTHTCTWVGKAMWLVHAEFGAITRCIIGYGISHNYYICTGLNPQGKDFLLCIMRTVTPKCNSLLCPFASHSCSVSLKPTVKTFIEIQQKDAEISAAIQWTCIAVESAQTQSIEVYMVKHWVGQLQSGYALCSTSSHTTR